MKVLRSGEEGRMGVVFPLGELCIRNNLLDKIPEVIEQLKGDDKGAGYLAGLQGLVATTEGELEEASKLFEEMIKLNPKKLLTITYCMAVLGS